MLYGLGHAQEHGAGAQVAFSATPPPPGTSATVFDEWLSTRVEKVVFNAVAHVPLCPALSCTHTHAQVSRNVGLAHDFPPPGTHPPPPVAH